MKKLNLVIRLFCIVTTALLFMTNCSKPDQPSNEGGNSGGNNNGGGGGNNQIPSGVLNGVFSVSDFKQVSFSKGNLQFHGNTRIWKFAENQWDYLGDNGQGGHSPNAIRDLFGWGTSGWDNGAIEYEPFSTSTISTDYSPGGSSSTNLANSYANADWGVYNPIQNGGNSNNLWRTLSAYEWEFLFQTRYTNSHIRYAMATVNNIKGLILVPDNWDASTFNLNNTNNSHGLVTDNVISSEDWKNILEPLGAVFLPTAGWRYGNTVSNCGNTGMYWSTSSFNADKAQALKFDSLEGLTINLHADRCYGYSVRLVKNVN